MSGGDRAGKTYRSSLESPGVLWTIPKQVRPYHCFNPRLHSPEYAHQPLSLTLPCLCDREQAGDGAPALLILISGSPEIHGNIEVGAKVDRSPTPARRIVVPSSKPASPHLNSSGVSPGSPTQQPQLCYVLSVSRVKGG